MDTYSNTSPTSVSLARSVFLFTLTYRRSYIGSFRIRCRRPAAPPTSGLSGGGSCSLRLLRVWWRRPRCVHRLYFDFRIPLSFPTTEKHLQVTRSGSNGKDPGPPCAPIAFIFISLDRPYTGWIVSSPFPCYLMNKSDVISQMVGFSAV